MTTHASEFVEGGPSPRRSPWVQALGLVVSLLISYAAAWLGSVATMPNIPTWYAALNKPFFNPPNAVFPIAWGILYTLMAVAVWLVWREEKPPIEAYRRTAFVAYAVQLALNVAWSFVFFGAHNPPVGLLVAVALFLAIVWATYAFRRVSGLAALLMLPYVAWVAFATALNASIWVLNR